MNIKYDSAIRKEGVDCFIISYFQKLKGVYDYVPSNIFARARLVWTQHLTEYPSAKIQTLRPLRLVIVSDVFILEQIVSTIKYLCILSRHIEAIVYL